MRQLTLAFAVFLRNVHQITLAGALTDCGPECQLSGGMRIGGFGPVCAEECGKTCGDAPGGLISAAEPNFSF